MADPLQDLIRSLPACFDGRGVADFCESIAVQAKATANSNDSWWDRLTDFGESTTIYSADKVVQAANELELFGQSLRSQSGPFCNASFEKNKLITLLGNVYGLLGAQTGVSASLTAARARLASDIIENAKDVGGGILDYSKWLIVGAVAIAAIVVITKYGK